MDVYVGVVSDLPENCRDISWHRIRLLLDLLRIFSQHHSITFVPKLPAGADFSSKSTLSFFPLRLLFSIGLRDTIVLGKSRSMLCPCANCRKQLGVVLFTSSLLFPCLNLMKIFVSQVQQMVKNQIPMVSMMIRSAFRHRSAVDLSTHCPVCVQKNYTEQWRGKLFRIKR